MLSEGYSWQYNLDVMRFYEFAPLPNIFITNYAIAHRIGSMNSFQTHWNNTEYLYWTKQRPKSLPLPQYRFFQAAKEMVAVALFNMVCNEWLKEHNLE